MEFYRIPVDAGGASGFAATSMRRRAGRADGEWRWDAVEDVEREKTSSARAFFVDYLFFCIWFE